MEKPSAYKQWGKWTLCPNMMLVFNTNEVEIELQNMASSAAILDWIFHVAGKSFIKPQDVVDLLSAIDECLVPQAFFCFLGTETGRCAEAIDLLKKNLGYKRDGG